MRQRNDVAGARRASPLHVIALLLALPTLANAAEPKVLLDQQSQFNRVIVTEDALGIRHMRFEEKGATQSAYDPRHPDQLIAAYTRTAMVGLALVPEPKRMLVVGLGGGSMSKFLRHVYPDAIIDNVELDPVVVKAAKEFFGFREDDHMKAFVGDGRAFVEKSDQRYDIIFLDAFGAESVPYALATREFLRAVREHLSESGIVVANIQGVVVNKLYPSMVLTYRDVFEELHIIKAPGFENRIFLALPKKLDLTEDRLAGKAAELQRQRKFDFDLAYMIRAGYEPTRNLPAGAKVLVDSEGPK